MRRCFTLLFKVVSRLSRFSAIRRNTAKLLRVNQGENARHLTPELIKMGTLTGTGPEIIDRVRELEAAGVTNIALNVCGTDAREMIREFGREVIDKY